MSKSDNILYICPWSLADPLCQTQSLAYIRQLLETGQNFSLITFEVERYRLDLSDTAAEYKLLRDQGIEWFPIKWDSGTSILSKLAGIARVLAVGTRICIRTRPKMIHSRSSLPAFMAVCLSKLFRTKYLYDADSLLSEEYADSGHMKRNSWGFRFLTGAEGFARKNADRIIVLTGKLRADYKKKFLVTTTIDVIPCCVDLNRFADAVDFRETRRRELGLGSERLFIYVGKAGSWYLIDETFELFRNTIEKDPSSRLLIITPDDPEIFRNIAKRSRIEEEFYSIRSSPFTEVGSWMAAADVAIALIKPVPSKRGSSPVKVAEYLACGLPIIANSGVGDVDELIENNGVGVLIREFNHNAYLNALNDIEALGDISEKCREVARREFDLETVGGVRYRRIYTELLAGNK